MHVIVKRERERERAEKKREHLCNNKRRRPSSSTETRYFVCIRPETFLKSEETGVEGWRLLWFMIFPSSVARKLPRSRIRTWDGGWKGQKDVLMFVMLRDDVSSPVFCDSASWELTGKRIIITVLMISDILQLVLSSPYTQLDFKKKTKKAPRNLKTLLICLVKPPVCLPIQPFSVEEATTAAARATVCSAVTADSSQLYVTFLH